LVGAVAQIKNDISPDWLVIEATGLAFLTEIRDLFNKYNDPDIDIYGACVVDVTRWSRLLLVSPDLMKNQVESAEVVIVNKTDLKSPEQKQLDEIISFSDIGVHILTSSGQEKSKSLWQDMLSAFGLSN